MDHNESKQLHDTINSLISKANAWDSIDKFFNTNKEIEEIYKEVRSECARDGNYGAATVFIETITRLLELAEI